MVSRSLLLVVALAFLAVSTAFPAEQEPERNEPQTNEPESPEESGPEDVPSQRTTRFLNRLGLSESLSSSLQGLTNRLSNRDRGTIDNLLSSLSERISPPSPSSSFSSFLGALESVLS